MAFRTLTPLWTGGVEAGKMERIHETGIIGSLRWWFEVFMRGFGGMVNDPTKDERSGFDSEKYKKSQATDERARLRDAGLCDVSQVFGATGWRRRFRLTIIDQTQRDTSLPTPISADRTNSRTNKKPTWWFPDQPRSGNLTIQMQSLDRYFPAGVIGGLLQFVADWAAVGAKAQMGFGVVEPVSGRVDTRPLYDWLVAAAGNRQYPKLPNLPNLQNIFLARIQLQNATDQSTFNLKYDLRQLFAGQQNTKLRHFIMGTVEDGRMAAKVKMSRPYCGGLMRIWGWIPDQADVDSDKWDREKVVDAIYKHLSTNYTLQVWREMNSPRDSVTPNNVDIKVFSQSLLGLGGEDDAARLLCLPANRTD
ncbi:MAG: type III-B CRISPR module RAMP protein Cmr1 [Dehalococcoidia bacterium]|nr:MAG: type III-B CRISPR module RAMP protein Cmr1 [Dehalococcoidia bacterium]